MVLASALAMGLHVAPSVIGSRAENALDARHILCGRGAEIFGTPKGLVLGTA